MKRLVLVTAFFLLIAHICFADPTPLVNFDYKLGRDPVSVPITLDGNPYLITAGINYPYVQQYWFTIFKNDQQIFKTRIPGDIGKLYATTVRGTTDLLLSAVGGTLGVSRLEIITIDENGEAVILANDSYFAFLKYATFIKIVDTTDKISIEYTPAGTRLRYRADILWDSNNNSFTETEPINITEVKPVPVVDKTIHFALNPVDHKIHYYVDGTTINNIDLKLGTKLLIKRDAIITSSDLAFSCWSNETDNSIINVDFVNGDVLISTKKLGITKLSLFKPHDATTVGELEITVE